MKKNAKFDIKIKGLYDKKKNEQGKTAKNFRKIVQFILQKRRYNDILDTVIKISTSIGKQARDKQFNKKEI